MPHFCWFSHINSEMVKAASLEFCSIQQFFISDIRVKFGIPNVPQSLDNGQNSGKRISHFWISGQSLINEDCHNLRTSHDIGIKLAPVTKLEKDKHGNVKIVWQLSHVGKLWRYCPISSLWPTWSHPEAVKCMVYKTYFSVNNNL